MAGRRNRRKSPRREVRWPRINWPALISAAATVATAAAAYVGTLWLMDRPIDSVVINGAFERVSAMQVKQALEPHVRTGFLSADLEAMRTDVVAIPWVSRATVRRRWPGVIELGVTEEEAVACWGSAGLLNADGRLFVTEAAHVPAELPRLSGPDGSEARVAALYFDIERRLEQRGLAAVRLALDARGAWTFELSNGIRVRLGGESLGQRLTRFFAALDGVVAPRVAEIEYVDMRYTNGFAIGWRDPRPAGERGDAEDEPNV